ncbi:MAG: DUF1653 domain-containing protein [Geobacteraceae bacterium]|nr:DUF1653 domain-containing protein [Geobacteraceae bacterium]
MDNNTIDSEILPRPGRYRHYKGNEYEVIGIACHSETEEELVVYRKLYGDNSLWVRPRGMFLESVTVGSQVKQRFEWLGEMKTKGTSG